MKPGKRTGGHLRDGRRKSVVRTSEKPTAKPVVTTSEERLDSLAEWVNEGGAGGEVKRPARD